MAKKKVNIKVMEFDKWLGNQGALGQRGTYTADDDLDGVMREATKIKVRRLKSMELDKYLIESEQELEKLKRGESLSSTGGPLPSNTDFLNMAKFMADLSPEESARVRNAYSFLKLAEKGGGSGMNMLPMLLNYARQNPGASQNEMVNYLKLMDSQFSKGLEIARAMSPNPANAETNAVEFLKLMKELVIAGVRDPLLHAMEKFQPQPGVLDQILTNPVLLSNMKELGIFGGGSGATTQLDLEIEKLRGERHLQATKWELDLRRDELKRQDDDRRTDNIIAIFGPIAGALAVPAAQRMQQLGEQQATAYNPTGRPHTVMPRTNNPAGIPPRTMSNAIQIRCSCGYIGDISYEGPTPKALRCPECDQELVVGGNPNVSGNT